MLRRTWVAFLAAVVVHAEATTALRGEELQAGISVFAIAPQPGIGRPVYLAGQAPNRVATGVHDDLKVTTLLLRSGRDEISLSSIDTFGLPYPAIVRIRERMINRRPVFYAATHTHEAPDLLGLWGPTPKISGVDPDYLFRVEERVLATRSRVEDRMAQVRADYATFSNPTLLQDDRPPEVLDSVMRIVRFVRTADNRPQAVLIQWNSHPVRPKDNPLASADFPGVVVKELEGMLGCPAIYFSGASGGRIGTPTNRVKDPQGRLINDNNFSFIELYGKAVALQAVEALKRAEPLALTPLVISTQVVAVPLENRSWIEALANGVIERPVVADTGDPAAFGEPLSSTQLEGKLALVTEVTYVRLGDLHIAMIPGVLAPELVTGEFPDKVERNVDFPDAPPERSVASILPGKRFLVLSMANDQLGYLVPKNQWDAAAPFAHGATKPPACEQFSAGPDAARVVLEALERAVQGASPSK